MSTSTKEAPKWRRKLPFLLVAPYLVGVVWHALHPLVSVMTGHMEPRKWYIDENSLDPSYFKIKLQFEPLQQKYNINFDGSLCAAVPNNPRISCAQHPDALVIVKITPTNGAVRPVTEAIVLVLPWYNTFMSTSYQSAVLQLIHVLEEAKWLAKTVLIVTGSSSEPKENLTDTVDRFLNVYLGPVDGTSFRPPLPSEMNGLLLRNLIVVDVHQQEQQESSVATTTTTPQLLHDIRILPQGRRGVLPNMDLTFLFMFVYSRSIFMRTNKAVMTMHPYRAETKQWQEHFAPKTLPKDMQEWLTKMLELLAFEYSLALGPFPSHATALDRGIDALTLQASLAPNSDNTDAITVDLVQRLEYVLRPLSNLHERLHHSTSLYLLASPERFVKHEEYLVPNLLLLIPLVVRAISLVLVDIPSFHWPTVRYMLWWMLLLVATLHGVVAHIDKEITTYPFVAVYAVMTLFSLRLSSISKQTAQCVACTASLLVHIPIAFGHVSLAFPSALFWTPLIAFPTFASMEEEEEEEGTKRTSLQTKLISYAVPTAVIGITLPSILLVPRIFPEYTVYVRYGYIPLHALLALLYLS